MNCYPSPVGRRFSLVIPALLAIGCALPCGPGAWGEGAPPAQLTQGLFDMGTADSPVERDHIRVTDTTVFASEKGYGWVQKAEGSFDRPKAASANALLRDGVFAKDDLVFRLMLKPGRYYLRILVGDPGTTRERMSVYAMGQPLGTGLSTRVNWWRGEPTSLLVSAVIEFTGEGLEFQFFHEGTANSVQAIQVLPESPVPVDPGAPVESLKGRDDLAPFHPALDAYRGRDFRAAMEKVAQVYDPNTEYLKAWILASIAGRLDCTEDPAEVIRRSIQVLDGLLLKDPTHAAARKRRLINQDYLQALSYMRMHGYSDVVGRTGTGWGERRKVAQNLLSQIPANDPLYVRALFDQGCITYWVAQKTDDPLELSTAVAFFRSVSEKYPDLPLARMYLGEKVPWGRDYESRIDGAPEWALRQGEIYARLRDIMDFWRTKRQSELGEFGGGWGDDVEMMRWWQVPAFACGSPETSAAMRRLADGVWTRSGLIENGFFRGCSDVQSSAEITSDSQPPLLALDYGSPTSVERCIESARLMGTVWTALNGQGHRLFRSVDLGATCVGEDPLRALDVPYHGRAVLPAHWVLWYNRNPEVERLFKEWVESWLQACASTEKGKPTGVPPAGIAFVTGELGGPGNVWYNPRLGPVYYYFPGGIHLLFEDMLAMYLVTGDEKYLAPLKATLDLLHRYVAGQVNGGEVGGEGWAAKVLLQYDPLKHVYAKWRLVTGKTDYDGFLKEHGSSYVRWTVTGNKQFLVDGCHEALSTLRWNYELLTSEVRYTDRVAITGMEHVLAMATGGCGTPGAYPAWQVTWEPESRNFAALVLPEKGPNLPGRMQSFRALLYQFESLPIRVNARLWALEPGEYEFLRGSDRDANDQMDQVEERKALTVLGPGAPLQFTLQPRTLHEVSVRQVRPRQGLAARRPDVAVAPEDIRVFPPRPVTGERIFVGLRVHNIGSAPARNVTVQVCANEVSPAGILKEQVLDSLDAPDDLRPRWKWVWWDSLAKPGMQSIQVKCRMEGAPEQEITQENNGASVTLQTGTSVDKAFDQLFLKGKLTDRLVSDWVALAEAYWKTRPLPMGAGELQRIQSGLEEAQADAGPDEARLIRQLLDFIRQRGALGQPGAADPKKP